MSCYVSILSNEVREYLRTAWDGRRLAVSIVLVTLGVIAIRLLL